MHTESNSQLKATPLFSRREFFTLGRSAALGLALASGCSTSPSRAYGRTPWVGTQLYGWGQYYERAGRKMSAHVDEILSAVRDCGYDYAEGTLDLNRPENNGKFADRCKAKGLHPVSYYTGGRLHEEGHAAETVQRIMAAAKACPAAGSTVINCNPDPIGREKTDLELTTQVNALKDLGAGLNQLGMHLGIHHHTPEFRNRAREFHYNFENSEPRVVGFCYDVHWAYRGGLAPSAVLPKYGGRIVSWHLRQSRAGIWWEDLDRGDLNYNAVARFARRHQLAPYFTVELALEPGTQITRSVMENHRRSREFVRSVFAA